MMQMPYYSKWINALRCGLYSMLLWTAVVLCALVFNSEGHSSDDGHYHWDTTDGPAQRAATWVRGLARLWPDLSDGGRSLTDCR